MSGPPFLPHARTRGGSGKFPATIDEPSQIGGLVLEVDANKNVDRSVPVTLEDQTLNGYDLPSAGAVGISVVDGGAPGTDNDYFLLSHVSSEIYAARAHTPDLNGPIIQVFCVVMRESDVTPTRIIGGSAHHANLKGWDLEHTGSQTIASRVYDGTALNFNGGGTYSANEWAILSTLIRDGKQRVWKNGLHGNPVASSSFDWVPAVAEAYEIGRAGPNHGAPSHKKLRLACWYHFNRELSDIEHDLVMNMLSSRYSIAVS